MKPRYVYMATPSDRKRARSRPARLKVKSSGQVKELQIKKVLVVHLHVNHMEMKIQSHILRYRCTYQFKQSDSLYAFVWTKLQKFTTAIFI